MDIAKEMKLWPLVAAALTPRERQVADCLLRGMGDKDISAELGIRMQTVKFYTSNMRRKFDLPACMNPRVVLAVKLYEYSR